MGNTKNVQSRSLVLDILTEYEKDGRGSTDILKAVLDKHDYLDARDKAFIKRLAEGCLERAISLDHVIDSYASTKTARMKLPVKLILRMGAYQILYMDAVPDSAACNESVMLAAKKGFVGLKGFVNGVLRNISRNKADISWPDEKRSPERYLSVYYSMPLWIVEKINSYYGHDTAKAMFEAFLKTRPVCVNVLDNDKKELIAEWEKAGVRTEQSPYDDRAVMLYDVPGVSRLYGFEEGRFIVQDVSSMLAVKAAGIKEGDTVIDLCAAPGGKSLMAAKCCGITGRVLSYDISEAKVSLIKENAERLKCANIEAAVHDAAVYDPVLADKADVLIADLPCSGLGVMGRKADIRYRLKPGNIEELSMLQKKILDNAARYVRPGGLLLYSTCTVSSEENGDNRQWFIENHDYEAVSFYDTLPASLRCDSAKEGQLQLLSGLPEGMPVLDGFYISLFRRKE